MIFLSTNGMSSLHKQYLPVTPNVSSYAYHHVAFNYNRMPLAPMGHAVQFQIKPGRCKTWDEHSIDGWYLQTSPEHYRLHIVFVKNTRYTQIIDTIYFKHKYPAQPTVTPADAIVKAYQDFTKAIQGIPNSKGTAHLEALQQLKQSFEP